MEFSQFRRIIYELGQESRPKKEKIVVQSSFLLLNPLTYKNENYCQKMSDKNLITA